MKARITIYLYVALLPSIIYGIKSIDEYVNDVIDIAKDGGRIEDRFQPTGEQALGKSDYSFVFQGILHPKKKVIAMKFTRMQKEYEIYTYLNATEDPDVEQYGIPSMFYHGQWNENNLIMFGISLLGESIQKLQDENEIFANDVNVLIVIRDFIFSSKYIHGRRVRHNDIKLAHIMVRNHQTFIIDFSLGSKSYDITTAGTMNFAPRRAHVAGGERWPKDDWESFLYSICHSLGARFKWIVDDAPHRIPALKSDTAATIRQIETIRSETLKNILVPFAKHVFDDVDEIDDDQECDVLSFKNKMFPDYDHFYKLVNEEINKLNLPEPVLYTWLTDEQRNEAEAYLDKHKIPDIATLRNPKHITFKKYPQVNSLRKKGSSSSSSTQNSISSDKSSKPGKGKGKMSGWIPFRSSKDKK